jgi:hypothetical protein
LFEEIAKLSHVDVLVHVSVADLQRNADRYTSQDYDQFDEFAPGWRKVIGTDMNQQALRGELLKYWSGKVEALGLPRAKHCELITGPKSQRLYWLIFLVGGEAQLPDIFQNQPKGWLRSATHGSICIQEGYPSRIVVGPNEFNPFAIGLGS